MSHSFRITAASFGQCSIVISHGMATVFAFGMPDHEEFFHEISLGLRTPKRESQFEPLSMFQSTFVPCGMVTSPERIRLVEAPL